MKMLPRAMHMLALSVTLAGCASYNMIKQPPAQPQPISLAIAGDGPSGWSDLPIGVYRVPKTNVIISGHQGNAAGVGMMFGLVGVLAADAIGTSEGAKAVKNAEDALHVDLVPQAAADTQAALSSGRFGQAFILVPATDKPMVTVIPFTVITFVNDTEVQPYVILKTVMAAGKDPKSAWTTRYIATVGKPMTLAGDNSLTADGGALLKTALNTGLERAVGAMLDDVANRPVRDDKKMIYVESGVPYTKLKVGMPGYLLAEDDKSVVFAPKVADALVFAGVYVADKSVTTPRPATADDKLKLVEEGK
jgi:hypothetical protein